MVLRHLAVLEAQATQVIADRRLSHGRSRE
jgi:hypothetical protein